MNNADKTCVEPHHLTSATPEFINASSPTASSPINAKSHLSHESHKSLHLPPLPSGTSLNHEFIHNDILHVNVGGRLFTTTKNTMNKSGLFRKLLSRKEQGTEANKSESVKRQTTFENYCVEHLEKKKNNELDGVYEIHSNYYFVDRSPSKFDDILHFLRDYPAVNSQQFIDRYYTCSPSQKSMHRNSLSSSLSISSSLSSSTSDNNINLLKLQDEARFYEIHPLINSIQEKLDEFHHNAYRLGHDDDGYDRYKWWDKSGPLKGLRRLSGTRIAFATSHDNWADTESSFEVPSGFRWATQSEYLEEYHSKRELLATYKEWIHFGIGDWNNYRWKYARKVAFLFKDTFKSQRFVHSGMEVCDINHVKTLCGYMSESPLMEYDESKGIIEGFAGLVLLSDEAWFESPPSDTDTWTSDEDDEQIQSLKRKQLASHKGSAAAAAAPHKTAPVSVSHLPPPQLANAFAEYTKKQRAALTKNNLMKHTLLETEKQNKFVPLHHSPQYIHQLPHYSYCGQLPTIPAPQLQPRLSVNSLPLKTTNHNLLMQHHQNQKQ